MVLKFYIWSTGAGTVRKSAGTETVRSSAGTGTVRRSVGTGTFRRVQPVLKQTCAGTNQSENGEHILDL